MKIKDLELFKVPPRWLFLKIITDEGITGWGEPIVEGKAATVKTAVEEMGTYLIDKDPRKIEDIFQMLYRGGFYRGGPVLMSAISGIEQALWDIKGKDLNLPVHEILGGPVREKVKVYSGIGGETPAELAESAKSCLDKGYTAVKTAGISALNWIDCFQKVQQVVERIQAVRDKVGYKLDIAVDFHGRVHKGMAKVLMKELEPFKLMFIEEPVLTENKEAFIELQKHTSTPIATGERNYGRWGFKDIIHDGGIDIIQPDLSHAGGIFECRKIAAMAEAYDVAVAPHCPLGPIALASCFQLDLCTPNAFIQEGFGLNYFESNSNKSRYLKNSDVFKFEEGYVLRLTAPGLGIEIDEKKVKKAAQKDHNWKNTVWRTEEGIVTEW